MTVESTVAYSGPYVTNGTATAFPFAFRALSTAEVSVQIDGEVVDPALYMVALSAQSGVVTFFAAPADGQSLYVISDPSFQQEILFSNQAAFLPNSHNEANDRGAIRDIALRAMLARTLRVPIGLSASDLAPEAGKFIAFDADKNPVMSSGTGADAGLRTDVSAPTGATLIGTSLGVTSEQALTGQRRRSVLEFMTPTQIADATSGAPTLDTWAAFDACVAWCVTNKYAMYIPAINTLLSKKITAPANLSVFSDPRGLLTWTVLSDCGWVVDGVGIPMGEAGFARIDLPRLSGPNDISGYFATPPVYDLTTFQGKALQIKDCIWCNVSVQYLIGWGVAFELIATTIPTDNHMVDLGTIDLCAIGISINSPAGATVAVGQSRITHRNVYAFTPFNFTGLGPGTFQMQIEGTSAFVNQTGGVVYYFTGTNHSNHTIRTGTAENHWAPDSPDATPNTMRGEIVAGDQTFLGEPRWASGTRLFIEASLPGTNYQAGDPFAFKLLGSGSRAVVKIPDISGTAIAPLSATQGEVNYNGGAGGAAVYRWTSVSADCNGLAAGATRNFYFYHQRLNPANYVPVQVSSAPGPTAATDIIVNALNNNAAVKREVIVQVTNRTGAALTGVYNLLLGVE